MTKHQILQHFKRGFSALLAFIVTLPSITQLITSADETEKYQYTLFGRNGITMSATSNLSINGNIHTNKEASVSSQNKNVNGRVTTGNDIEKRVKHVYADKKFIKLILHKIVKFMRVNMFVLN